MGIETILKTPCGEFIHGDNLEALKTIGCDSIDSCISDFPYNLSFMGKEWDNTKDFYNWNLQRAEELYRVLKPGGYAAIFGHPKTNHRMKCAFEDSKFKIVEEIDWIYLTGMPKNQDIGKLFIKNSKLELAHQWEGWKTAGLKPAHEPITVFQKPILKNYCYNIQNYKCGAMNIDGCRVPITQADISMINSKASKNPTTTYSDKVDKIYGKYKEDRAMPANPKGRFPPNVVFDSHMAKRLDIQTECSRLMGGSENIGVSRFFTIIKYCPKASTKEKKLSNGLRNSHVTVKPVQLYKWLIKLLTPSDGISIDITAGSGTHAIACELLNKEGYNVKWIDIEILNTEHDPYCDIAARRIKDLN